MLVGNNCTGFVIFHFQVETIVQIGFLTAMVTDDVFPQKKSSKQSLQCYPEKWICAYLLLDF